MFKLIKGVKIRPFCFFSKWEKILGGSPSNINYNSLSNSHAKFGAFIHPVTVISLSYLTTLVQVATL